MRVRVREAEVNGRPRVVINPLRCVPYPAGEFELSQHELDDPRVRRLLPSKRLGGVSGGVDGDLVPVPAKKGDK